MQTRDHNLPSNYIVRNHLDSSETTSFYTVERQYILPVYDVAPSKLAFLGFRNATLLEQPSTHYAWKTTRRGSWSDPLRRISADKSNVANGGFGNVAVLVVQDHFKRGRCREWWKTESLPGSGVNIATRCLCAGEEA